MYDRPKSPRGWKITIYSRKITVSFWPAESLSLKKTFFVTLQIEVIHNFKEKLPLWLLHRIHQSESVRRPNMKAKTMFQKIKVGGDRLGKGKVYIRAKRPIRPALIPVSVGWSDFYFYSPWIGCYSSVRESKKNTMATATRTSLNKRFIEQKNGCTRAL